MEWGPGTIVHSDDRRVGDRRRTDDRGISKTALHLSRRPTSQVGRVPPIGVGQ